jgi:hypothetical protein
MGLAKDESPCSACSVTNYNCNPFIQSKATTNATATYSSVLVLPLYSSCIILVLQGAAAAVEGQIKGLLSTCTTTRNTTRMTTTYVTMKNE